MQWSISNAGGRESPLSPAGAESSVLFYAFREPFRRYEISALEHIEENMKPFASWKKHLIVVVSYPHTV
jgi:hypothetical protein